MHVYSIVLNSVPYAHSLHSIRAAASMYYGNKARQVDRGPSTSCQSRFSTFDNFLHLMTAFSNSAGRHMSGPFRTYLILGVPPPCIWCLIPSNLPTSHHYFLPSKINAVAHVPQELFIPSTSTLHLTNLILTSFSTPEFFHIRSLLRSSCMLLAFAWRCTILTSQS